MCVVICYTAIENKFKIKLLGYTTTQSKKLELAIKKQTSLEPSYVVSGDIKWSNPITFENNFYIFSQN